VAEHQMTVEPVGQPECLLEIDLAGLIEAGVQRSVSGETSTLKLFFPRLTTVRQAPLTAMLSPTATPRRPSLPPSIASADRLRSLDAADFADGGYDAAEHGREFYLAEGVPVDRDARPREHGDRGRLTLHDYPGQPDGIGKAYQGREIAKVMSYHGAPWLERPERMQEERPDLVLAALDLTPGMKVADVGAEAVYYSLAHGERVGTSGTVYASTSSRMIEIPAAEHVETRRRECEAVLERKPNRSCRGDARPRDHGGRLPRARYPYEMLAAIVQALKPGGRVVFVEFRGDDRACRSKPAHHDRGAGAQRGCGSPLVWIRRERLALAALIVFRKR